MKTSEKNLLRTFMSLTKENDMGEPIYIETWEALDNPKGNLLDIAYTRSMCPTDEAIVMFRHNMAETHKCVLWKLLRTRKIELEEE